MVWQNMMKAHRPVINTASLGTAGDANDKFGASGNFNCTEAGTYKIVYTIATEKIDFYVVNA